MQLMGWLSKIFFSPSGIGGKSLALGKKILSNISQIMRDGTALRLFAYTITMWIADALFYFAVASSVPALMRPLASFSMVSVCALSLVVPSAPGGLGTFNYFGILSMTVLGNDRDSATAAVVLIHFCVLFVPLFCFLLWNIAIKIWKR
jgi:uncharacterized membrane protein YbhN (UPF0104 family)